MRENHTSGSVQGVPGNRHSYCDTASHHAPTTLSCWPSYRILSVTYAMMHSPMRKEAENQAREDTRWALSQ